MTNIFYHISNILAKHNFESSGKNLWQRDLTNVKMICQFQKSRYSQAGFLNFGLYFNELIDDKIKKIIKIDDCHTESRFEGIVGQTGFAGLFPIDMTNEDDIELINYMEESINNEIIPFLLKYSDLNLLMKELKSGDFDFNKMLVGFDY